MAHSGVHLVALADTVQKTTEDLAHDRHAIARCLTEILSFAFFVAFHRSGSPQVFPCPYNQIALQRGIGL
jgi:hypothetical protein